MAMFVLSKRAKSYFDRLNQASSATTGSIRSDLEEWWLCAQIGLLAGVQGKEPEAGSPDMVRYFIKSLQPSQARIRGLLLMRQLEAADAGGMKREVLERAMAHVLCRSESHLTAAGVAALNRYATHGFEVVMEEIGPQIDLYVFMLEYHALVQRMAADHARR